MIDLVIYKTWEGEPQNETKALLIRENREGSGDQWCPPHEITVDGELHVSFSWSL